MEYNKCSCIERGEAKIEDIAEDISNILLAYAAQSGTCGVAMFQAVAFSLGCGIAANPDYKTDGSFMKVIEVYSHAFAEASGEKVNLTFAAPSTGAMQ